MTGVTRMQCGYMGYTNVALPTRLVLRLLSRDFSSSPI